METAKATRASRKVEGPSRLRWTTTNIVLPLVIGVLSSGIASWVSYRLYRQQIAKLLNNGLAVLDVKQTTAQLDAITTQAEKCLSAASPAGKSARDIAGGPIWALQRLYDELDRVNSLQDLDRIREEDASLKPTRLQILCRGTGIGEPAGMHGVRIIKERIGLMSKAGQEADGQLSGYTNVDLEAMRGMLQTIRNTSHQTKALLDERVKTMQNMLNTFPPD